MIELIVKECMRSMADFYISFEPCWIVIVKWLSNMLILGSIMKPSEVWAYWMHDMQTHFSWVVNLMNYCLELALNLFKIAWHICLHRNDRGNRIPHSLKCLDRNSTLSLNEPFVPLNDKLFLSCNRPTNLHLKRKTKFST